MIISKIYLYTFAGPGAEKIREIQLPDRMREFFFLSRVGLFAVR
jgi:hypothetical protein